MNFKWFCISQCNFILSRIFHVTLILTLFLKLHVKHFLEKCSQAKGSSSAVPCPMLLPKADGYGKIYMIALISAEHVAVFGSVFVS